MSVYKLIAGCPGFLLQENGDFLLQENDGKLGQDGAVVALMLTATGSRTGFTALSNVTDRSIGDLGFIEMETGYYLLQEDDGKLDLEGTSFPFTLTTVGSRNRFFVE